VRRKKTMQSSVRRKFSRYQHVRTFILLNQCFTCLPFK
jgi:hypothetical protein